MLERNLCLHLHDLILRRTTVDEATGCWIWKGATQRGYGRINMIGYENLGVHRASYEAFIGNIPEEGNWHIHHRCANRICANPLHLQLMTAAEHVSLPRPDWMVFPQPHQQKYIDS